MTINVKYIWKCNDRDLAFLKNVNESDLLRPNLLQQLIMFQYVFNHFI